MWVATFRHLFVFCHVRILLKKKINLYNKGLFGNLEECMYGFIPKKSTTDAVLTLKLKEKYGEGQMELNCLFVDLEKKCIYFLFFPLPFDCFSANM